MVKLLPRRAMEIISSDVHKFSAWVESLDAVPTIVKLRNHTEDIRKEELEKTFKKLSHLSGEDRNILEQMSATMINRIFHNPTVNLKQKTKSSEGQSYIKAIRELFHLDD